MKKIERTMDDSTGQVAIAVVLLLQTGLQMWERRQRRTWELEDRQAKDLVKKTLEEATEDLKKTSDETAARLAVSTADIKKGLEQNTKLTRQVGKKADAAYSEANHVNRKIEEVGKVRRTQLEERRTVDKDEK